MTSKQILIQKFVALNNQDIISRPDFKIELGEKFIENVNKKIQAQERDIDSSAKKIIELRATIKQTKINIRIEKRYNKFV